MAATGGDATDGVRTGLAGAVANQMATDYSLRYPNGDKNVKQFNSYMQGLANGLNSAFGGSPSAKYITQNSAGINVAAGAPAVLVASISGYSPSAANRSIECHWSFTGTLSVAGQIQFYIRVNNSFNNFNLSFNLSAGVRTCISAYGLLNALTYPSSNNTIELWVIVPAPTAGTFTMDVNDYYSMLLREV
jgi:hypothetical protein